MAHHVTPSILSADFANLQGVCEMINSSEADGFHLDVMDGVFVPNISFGFPVIKAIKRHARKPLDMHLMIVQSERYLERFRDAGANILTVHIEACAYIQSTIDAIKKLDMEVCIAIKPETPLSVLDDIIADIEAVCVMSVNPGFGGQTFMESTFDKVKELKAIIRSANTKALIKVDGGIDLSNYIKLVDAGADILIAGTSVFGAKDPVRAIEALKKMQII